MWQPLFDDITMQHHNGAPIVMSSNNGTEVHHFVFGHNDNDSSVHKISSDINLYVSISLQIGSDNCKYVFLPTDQVWMGTVYINPVNWPALKFLPRVRVDPRVESSERIGSTC